MLTHASKSIAASPDCSWWWLSFTNALQSLVASQGEELLLDAVLGDELDGDGVAGVDVSLARRREHVLDDADGLLWRQRHRRHVLLVLVVDLVVQQRLNQRTCRNGRTLSPR